MKKSNGVDLIKKQAGHEFILFSGLSETTANEYLAIHQEENSFPDTIEYYLSSDNVAEYLEMNQFYKERA